MESTGDFNRAKCYVFLSIFLCPTTLIWAPAVFRRSLQAPMCVDINAGAVGLHLLAHNLTSKFQSGLCS